jgi:hypothetical protein
MRLDGWRNFQSVFGAPTPEADMPLAVRGYFENGGEIAYVIRVLGEPRAVARGSWKVGDVDPLTNDWTSDGPSGAAFRYTEYEVTAASPGSWANGTQVTFHYKLRGDDGKPRLDIEVGSPYEPTEYLHGLPVDELEAAVAERSTRIHLTGKPLAPAPAATRLGGPLSKSWPPVSLEQGISAAPRHGHYLEAAESLRRQREVALIAVPDLYRMRGTVEQRQHVVATLVAHAEDGHDRQVLATTPPDLVGAEPVLLWLAERRESLGDRMARSLAVYHPWIEVLDPSGSTNAPLRTISPVGHVAGVISRLDRERGAHHTPANALLYDVVDVAGAYEREAQGVLIHGGVNLLRCQRGQGVQLWGGRTVADPRFDREGLFIAHRRLTHRLIRAIRRVSEPLVFDVNGQELWLTIVRGITSILLEAFRAGALKGARAEEAFLVRCDESTNPPEEQELGRVVSEIHFAPAAPMEFITLRIAVSKDGRLEAIEP